MRKRMKRTKTGRLAKRMSKRMNTRREKGLKNKMRKIERERERETEIERQGERELAVQKTPPFEHFLGFKHFGLADKKVLKTKEMSNMFKI